MRMTFCPDDVSSTEVWKDVPGYEGRYQVSSLGDVRSVPRVIEVENIRGQRYSTRRGSGKVLKTCIGSNGYKYVGVWSNKANSAKFVPVHHIVASAFLGPRPDGSHICHDDGDKGNNAAANLRYDSPRENHLDVYRAGGKYGKLSVDQARDVKRLLATGETISSIAAKYGVSRAAIRFIKKGEHFGWID